MNTDKQWAETDIPSAAPTYPRDTALIHSLARAFLGDTGGQVFTDKKFEPFLENAITLHPESGDRRLAAITAMCAADSKGWHESACSLRQSISAGLI